MSRPVVALCRWQDFNYAGTRGLDPIQVFASRVPLWNDRDEPPTACRASLGDKWLTVWLPQGAVIRSRAVQYFAGRPGGAMAGEYVHDYGTHERGTRTKIRITLNGVPDERYLRDRITHS